MTDVDVRSPGSGDSAEHKRKHIVWNEENLSYNEANKSVRRGATPPNPGAFHPSFAPLVFGLFPRRRDEIRPPPPSMTASFPPHSPRRPR